MINDKHFHPVIFKKLQGLIANGDFEGLFLYLQSLSNSHFRTAGFILGERFVPDLGACEMWSLVNALVQYNSKAFLVTMLKAVAQRADVDELLVHDGFSAFCDLVKSNEVDVQKTLQQLLPYRCQVDQIRALFLSLGLTERRLWIPYLLRITSVPSNYVLFASLRDVEHDHDYLVRIAYYLMKKGDGLSFNLASLIRTYFGLEEVKGTFSLHLKPYELARIEASFDAFQSVMSF